MTQTQPQRPSIPTGQELYDQIMGHIEPELTTEGLKLLEAHYKDETPEQLAARKQRYALAFERYDQAYSEYIETLQAQVDRYRRESVRKVEVDDRQQEAGMLDNLSQMIFKES